MRIRSHPLFAASGALLAAALAASPAAAQKAGGIAKIYHRDSPPSASIHEEATNSTNIPFMGIFNNLVVYNQQVAQNSMDTIVPDLAESWRWSDDGKQLTFKLREGVKWHDGKPFTSKDVQCTWDMLMEKSEQKFRKNPRQSWYDNVEKVATSGDHEATFYLKRPQPSLLAMLAGGYTPVYPCHVPPRDMRVKPIGTGPFKLGEFKQNEYIRLVKNPDYFKKGRPYLDGIEFTIITNRSTRILAFVAGDFDMTYPSDVTIPLIKDVKAQAPQAICQVIPTNVNRNLIVNRDKPPFDNADVRRAMALALDRKSFIDILSEGQADAGGALLPQPEGVWGMPAEMLKTIPGYGGDVQKNREEARAIMQKLGYGPDKRLPVKISTRNIAIYRDPAVILIDQLRDIYIDGELEVVETANWHAKVGRKDFSVGMNLTGNGLDDPDQAFYENYACGSERNYTQYCNKDLEKLFDQQSMETDIGKRKQLVWEIDRRLQEDGARPTIYHERSGTCWHPHLKGYVPMVNSSYNGYRFEDLWLDK